MKTALFLCRSFITYATLTSLRYLHSPKTAFVLSASSTSISSCFFSRGLFPRQRPISWNGMGNFPFANLPVAPFDGQSFKSTAQSFIHMRFNAVPHIAGHSAFYEGEIAWNETIPEAEEAIANRVDGFFPFFFKHGCFPLDDAKINQSCQIFAQGAWRDICFRRNLIR